MKGCVLIDSSVWIAATRQGGDPEVAADLEGLLLTGRAAMTAPVWMELYQGIRGNREEARLAESRRACIWLEFDAACWMEAASCARTCVRAGVNVPFGDILVQACASRHGVELLERDRHFAMIRKAMEA